MNCLRKRILSSLFSALVLLLGISSRAAAQSVEVQISSRIEVNNDSYTGQVSVKAAIVDSGNVTLWSNDGTSTSASEPTSSVVVTVLDGVFNLSLGAAGMTPLPGSVFDGTAARSLIIWMDAGEGFEQFDPLPISTVPRAVNALRLGGLPASDYLTTSSVLSVGNTNLSEPISSNNLEAFSNSGNDFTIGDGTASGNKSLNVDTGGLNAPALRYDVGTSKWQFSNDGLSFSDLSSPNATGLEGIGSTTSAVDLGTAEVAGVLGLANGGTGSTTAAAARTNLGVEIGVDVQPYIKNNLSAVIAPAVTDDSAAGYAVGSTWVDTVAQESYVALDVSVGAAVWVATTSASTASIADGAVTNLKLAADAVTSDKILDGEVANADISNTAAIGHNKLAPAGAGQVLLGNGSSVVTATSISGDATLNSVGFLTIGAGAVSGTKIGISGQATGDLLYYDGVSWTGLKNNFSAATAPSATDDSAAGYSVGSTWVDTVAQESYVALDVSAGAAVWVATTSASTATIADGAVTNLKLAADAVTADKILDGEIANADISNAAAISHNKLASAGAGQVLLGNAGNVVTATGISGDASLNSSGVLTIGAGAVSGTKIGIAGQAAGDLLYYDGVSWTGLKNNFSAAVAPTATDDSSAGYSVGSTWVDAVAQESYVALDVSAGAAVWVATTSASTASIADGAVTNLKLGADSVTADKILNGEIANADISNAAAISHSKLASAGAGQVLLGNGSNVVTATGISGDASLNSAGVLTISAGSVSGTKIGIAGQAVGDLLYYDGVSWAGLKNNFSASVAPAVTDDSTGGYSVGSTWVDTVAQESYVALDVSAGAAVWVSTTSASTASIADGAVNNLKLASDAVTSSKILDGEIVNADVSASAAIAHSKLAAVSAGQVLLGNGSNVATATAISGDATLNSAGVLTLSAGSVSGSEIGISGQTQGDLLFYNGSAWARLAAGTSGQVLQTNGSTSNPTWVAAGSGQAPHVVLNRRYGYSMPLTTTATAFTSVGMSTPTVSVAGTAQPAIANRMYIRYATSGAINNANGITGPLSETRPAFRPKYSTLVRTDSAITSRRIWTGLTTAVLNAVVTNTTGTTASAATFVGIAYDTNGTGNTTDWLCCSGDGSNYSCLTTGVAVAVSTEYTLTVDWSTAGSLICTVNSTSVTKSTNLGIGAVNMGAYNSLTALAAAVTNHFIAKQSLEQN